MLIETEDKESLSTQYRITRLGGGMRASHVISPAKVYWPVGICKKSQLKLIVFKNIEGTSVWHTVQPSVARHDVKHRFVGIAIPGSLHSLFGQYRMTCTLLCWPASPCSIRLHS